MTQHRWTLGDAELTNELRALYAAPTDAGYWAALEQRILAYVTRDEAHGWWGVLADMARPALVAAAALILAASVAMVRSQDLETRRAYASVISPPSDAFEPAMRSASIGDGDIALHYLLSR